MKKNKMILCTIIFMLFGAILWQAPLTTNADKNTELEQHHHDFITKEDFQRLLDKGYSKKDIRKAAHIAKYANKKTDDVLKFYKENNSSWKKTAEHYGLDMKKLKEECHEHKEKFLEEHKETVIEKVAEFSGKTESEIQAWLDEGVHLRFILIGAAMAKASNKDLAEVIKLKKEGQSFKDIKQNLNIDSEKMRDEMKALMKNIKDDIKD
ncbi:hypothetical protein [Cytobacillus dafuensis]|uniref:Uncharacterized protein n=1 Tax=Cytobacillus dafuensis TaxID=1742359 RepID=A0A5B8Z2I7_CYTDA|nr:hypothetical protein [Cytobacillus dafuensis]QED47091.1 hypothetical protein FSZ17_07425 [Cytobacillus dafuensis]